jgi:hypothetical protein
MAAANLSSLSPVRLNSTTLAAANLTLVQGNEVEPLQHSGNLFDSVMVAPGAKIAVRFRTPFLDAFNLLGFGLPTPLKLTTLDVFFAKFVDFARSTGSVHTKYALAASAIGCAYIKGFSVDEGKVLMAEVECIPLSADGMTHPLVRTANNAMITVAAEPTLHTLGPCQVNGTTLGGASGVDADTGLTVDVRRNDGDRFARTIAVLAGKPSLNVRHDAPEDLAAAIGLEGATLSSTFAQFFRDISASTGLTLTTGLKLTVASGRVLPVDQSAEHGAIAKGGLHVVGLSTSNATHPWAVATGQAVPTP